MRKFSFLALIICMLIGLTLMTKDHFSFFSQFTMNSNHSQIADDLIDLKEEIIPSEFLSLNQIYWQDHRKNPSAFPISHFFSQAFQVSQNGKYILQIDCFDQDNDGLITQMSFYELKTRNKVYEISRSYKVQK